MREAFEAEWAARWKSGPAALKTIDMAFKETAWEYWQAATERAAKVCDQIGRDFNGSRDSYDMGRVLGTELCSDAIRAGS